MSTWLPNYEPQTMNPNINPKLWTPNHETSIKHPPFFPPIAPSPHQERREGEFRSLRVCRSLDDASNSFDVELVRWGDAQVAWDGEEKMLANDVYVVCVHDYI